MVVANKKRISGTSWDTYLHILTSVKPQGVREVWRALNLSTPSLAQYHINKLLEANLIEATIYGKYRANEENQMAALQGFVLLRGRLIPRLVFYSTLILGILLTYLLLWPLRWDFRDLAVLAIALFSISAFLVEAFNQVKGLEVGKHR